MALPTARYAPRRPAENVLYTIVQAHFETFRTQAASLRDGEGLPRFVEHEFRELPALRLAGGRVRVVSLYGLRPGSADRFFV